MKALMLTTAAGPASVELCDVPSLKPGPGQVRVAVKAAAFNHRELWISRGQYPGMRLPTGLGCDGAGIVESVGEGVDPKLQGERVILYPGMEWGSDPRLPDRCFGLLGMPGPGTIAEAITLAAGNVYTMPGYLDFEAAAAVPLAALTAWRGLVTKGALAAGEKVLITGVGGGVAVFALQIALAFGATVYVTSGSQTSLDRARQLGARGGFDYREPDWRKTIARETGGLDLVFDGAPAAAFTNYQRALNPGARVVIYGSTAGPQFTVSAPDLFLRNIRILGTNVGNPDEFAALLGFIGEHRIQPQIDRSFPLEAAREALEYLDTSHRLGKVVVTIP